MKDKAARPIKTSLNLARLYQRQVQYDYTNQAWLVDGRYISCQHPASMGCDCFGKLHAGEPAQEGAEIH